MRMRLKLVGTPGGLLRLFNSMRRSHLGFKIFASVFAALLTTASLVVADTLLLRNGSTINGKFVNGDNRTVRFAVGNEVNSYDVADIDTLRFDGSAPPPAASYGNAPPQNYPAPPPAYPAQSNTYSAPPAPAPAQSPAYGQAGVEIPSGTAIVVRMIDGIDSARDRVGQTFRASLDVPVVVNGQTVIPQGADSVVVLAYSQESGKIEGKTVLTLQLKSVSVNGRTYATTTSAVAKASSSRTKRSGEVIGGTAALGAIIGAIAGGGRGAAIGAGSGAAVGTVAQVATSGQKVKVPAETQLTFALQNALDL